MEIKIKKAKLTKGGTIEATYIDEDGNEITLKGKNTVHVDLKARLAALIPYFAELTEQKEADRYDWLTPTRKPTSTYCGASTFQVYLLAAMTTARLPP